MMSTLLAQFSDPAGSNGSLSSTMKTIPYHLHYCTPPAIGHKKKSGTSRRLFFRATFDNNCWYNIEALYIFAIIHSVKMYVADIAVSILARSLQAFSRSGDIQNPSSGS